MTDQLFSYILGFGIAVFIVLFIAGMVFRNARLARAGIAICGVSLLWPVLLIFAILLLAFEWMDSGCQKK